MINALVELITLLFNTKRIIAELKINETRYEMKALSRSHMNSFNVGKRQKGNYLLSIGIGIMIMAILAVWGIPKVKDYLVEGAVPSVAEEIQRFIARVKVNSTGTGSEPYNGITQSFFARAVRGSSLQVATSAGAVAGEGTGGTIVLHGLGGGSAGTVTIATAESNGAITLTFADVNQAGCPGLATALQKTVDDISINGTSVKKVSTTDGTVTKGYVAGTAAAACVDGDANDFVFTVR
ncbi:type 4 pilus major pilin [Pseudomonas sp.]|nr:type 4 pilus major pilin [Pseudomonas sp.]